jgi:hypothetical protein
MLGAVALASLIALVPTAARADTVDTILKVVLPAIDPSLGDSYDVLKCAINHNGLNATTLKTCGTGLAKAKADSFLQGNSTAQTVVTVSAAAMQKQWATVIEVGGSELIVQLACTAAMPPGPVKSFLCSGVSAEVAKLAKPVLKGALDALSSSPPNWPKLLTLVGPSLACGIIPEPAHSAVCSPLMQVLEKGFEAGKDVAVGVAEGLTDGVGAVLEGFGDLWSPDNPKPTPKKFFQLYYVSYYHKGAWLKLVQGDAAFSQLVTKNHNTCVGYYGSGPCNVMKSTYVADITATVNALKAQPPLYLETRIQADDRFVLELQFAAWGSTGWGPGQCGNDLYKLFPLPEGGDEDSRPRPTVWVKTCEQVKPLLLAWLKAHQVLFATELVAFKNQGCTLLKYDAHLQCGTYPGHASCLQKAGRWSNRCEMDYAKADGAVALDLVKQLGKRCAPNDKLQTTIECTRPWKEAQCADLVAHTVVPSPWKKPQVKCVEKPDPKFEQGKVEALKLLGSLNIKPGGPPSALVSAGMSTGADCATTWDPLGITCKDPHAASAPGKLPGGLSSCPPDPNKDGADGPTPCYAGPYSFATMQEADLAAGHQTITPGSSPTFPTTRDDPVQPPGARRQSPGGGPRPGGPQTATGPIMPYRGLPGPGTPGSSVAVLKPGGPGGAPDITLGHVSVGGVSGRWGGALSVDARRAAGPSRSGPGLCDVAVQHTVKNAGLGAASAFTGSWRNGAVAGSWTHAYPPLGPGVESPTQTDTLVLRPGQNALSLRLDVRGQVGEANEGNNEARLMVTLTGNCASPPGPALTMPRSAPTPPSGVDSGSRGRPSAPVR